MCEMTVVSYAWFTLCFVHCQMCVLCKFALHFTQCVRCMHSHLMVLYGASDIWFVARLFTHLGYRLCQMCVVCMAASCYSVCQMCVVFELF